jgi:hypothetical protein
MKGESYKQVPALFYTVGCQGRVRHNIVRQVEVMITLYNLSLSAAGSLQEVTHLVWGKETRPEHDGRSE